jgi:hypothetical protein
MHTYAVRIMTHAVRYDATSPVRYVTLHITRATFADAIAVASRYGMVCTTEEE